MGYLDEELNNDEEINEEDEDLESELDDSLEDPLEEDDLFLEDENNFFKGEDESI
jgi:hypothetical protein